jgi:hypothetical protein
MDEWKNQLTIIAIHSRETNKRNPNYILLAAWFG